MFNALLYSVGGILIILIMIGSIFLIYNSFTISLNERTHQFGILSSVGATARQLRNSVLFEGLCIGAIGIPIGVIAGIGSISLVISFVVGNEDPSQSVAEMEERIQGAGVTSEYTLYNVNKIFEENRSIIFVVDVFTYVFVIVISLIAVANVFNTISTNIKLRRRELAMLRSVGMSDRDFKKMMNFECAFYGIRTLLFGLPIAGIF